MAELSRRFPQGLHFSIPYDTTIFVKDSINEVYKTLYQAGILVLIVILVFLQNFRATLVPATTVPVTIIGAFAAWRRWASPSICPPCSASCWRSASWWTMRSSSSKVCPSTSSRACRATTAAIKAMDELFGPIIGITLVLMAVFLPAAFVPGLTGNMFAQFALVIAATALISAVNAATLKPTQCALWLRTPVPPEQRNFFYRGFNRRLRPMERGYAAFIGRMVRRSGLMVVDRTGARRPWRIWGLARLPTAFIPIDDQGYLMVAVQLPEGASLGRTTASLEQVSKVALDMPGVEQVIAIAGMSVLDNSADLANAGTCWVMLKPFDVRLKEKDQDLLSIFRALQAAIARRCPTGGHSCCRRRRSRASATPAASRCSWRCSAAASTTRSSTIWRRRSSRQASSDPRSAERPHHLQARCAACRR